MICGRQGSIKPIQLLLNHFRLSAQVLRRLATTRSREQLVELGFHFARGVEDCVALRPHACKPLPRLTVRGQFLPANLNSWILFHCKNGFLPVPAEVRSEEHTSELQSLRHLVCRL